MAEISNASKMRVKQFVDWFLSNERVCPAFEPDWANDTDRSERCYGAAEFGCDGSTHYEHIQDWRNNFSVWLRDNHSNYWQGKERFANAVQSHFDEVELWREQNGTLHTEIG